MPPHVTSLTEETSEWLHYVCFYNPFTYAVETIRFSLYSQFNVEYALGIIVISILLLLIAACYPAYKAADLDPVDSIGFNK